MNIVYFNEAALFLLFDDNDSFIKTHLLASFILESSGKLLEKVK